MYSCHFLIFSCIYVVDVMPKSYEKDVSESYPKFLVVIYERVIRIAKFSERKHITFGFRHIYCAHVISCIFPAYLLWTGLEKVRLKLLLSTITHIKSNSYLPKSKK